MSGVVRIFVTFVLNGCNPVGSDGLDDLPRVRADIEPVPLLHDICRRICYNYDMFGEFHSGNPSWVLTPSGVREQRHLHALQGGVVVDVGACNVGTPAHVDDRVVSDKHDRGGFNILWVVRDP